MDEIIVASKKETNPESRRDEIIVVSKKRDHSRIPKG